MLPEHPCGPVDLEEDDLKGVAGGSHWCDFTHTVTCFTVGNPCCF